MASRNVRRVVKRQKKGGSGGVVFIALVVLGLISLGYYVRMAPSATVTKPSGLVEMTKSVSDDFKADIQAKFAVQVTQIVADTPDSHLLPPIVRQKVIDLVRRNQEGQITFVVDDQTSVGDPFTLMACICDQSIVAEKRLGKPGIAILPWVMQFTKKQSKLQSMTSFALTLYHESLHLDHWPLPSNPTPVQVLEEETRVYVQTSLEAVRPMIKKGLWVPSDFERIDRVLQICGDNAECSQFKALMLKQNPLVRNAKPAST